MADVIGIRDDMYIGEGHKDVGLFDFGVMDGLVRKDNVRAGGPAACFRAVGLRLHGDEPFMFHCGFGQQDRHGDHALPAGSGQQETGNGIHVVHMAHS
jgi:hypothetical protein